MKPERTRRARLGLVSLGAALLGASAFAGSAEPRVFYVGSFGRAGEAWTHDPENWVKPELDDWKNPVTGTTLLKDRRCGLELRYRLLGARRRNFLVLEARADVGAGPIRIEPSRITMSFETGAIHLAAFASDPGAFALQAGDRLVAALPFPDKGEFAGRSEVRIHVPVGSCEAQATFKRPTGQVESAASSTVWTAMQLGLEVGSGIAKTGDLKTVTGNGAEFNLTVTRYPWINHGFWMGFEFDGLGGGVSGVGALLGYSFRHYLSERWTVHAEVAPGIYEFTSSPSPQAAQSLDHAFVLGARLGVDWIFARAAILESDHAVGLLLSDEWFPGATLAGNPAAGQNISLQFRYLFGI